MIAETCMNQNIKAGRLQRAKSHGVVDVGCKNPFLCCMVTNRLTGGLLWCIPAADTNSEVMSGSMTAETSLLQSLRDGDEKAFTGLVEQYHSSLVRLAQLYVYDEAIAEEIAQETWLAALQGLNRFEGRSSLKTWIFTILTNKAKTRRQRENRSISFFELDEIESQAPTVVPERFVDDPGEKWVGHWKAKPASWAGIPEDEMLSRETMDVIRKATASLPENQRAVITLRDIEELSSDEVCNILGVSETNQRVLLHRARARVRQVLEDYLQLER